MALLEKRCMPLPSIVVITLATCHQEEFGCLFVSLMHLRRSTMACNYLLHVHDVAGQLDQHLGAVGFRVVVFFGVVANEFGIVP